MPQFFNPLQDDVLLRYYPTAMDVSEILQRVNDAGPPTWESGEQIRRRARHLGVRRENKPIPELTDEEGTPLEQWQAKRKRGDKPGWREIVEYMQRGADLQAQMRPKKDHAKRVIETDEPIAVVSMSDFHLGSPATDYESFVATTDLILSNDGLYCIVVGPDLETAFRWFKSAEAVLSQTAPPYIQVECFAMWLEEMLPRLLAITWDNHTAQRLEQYLGDFYLQLPEEISYFHAKGHLELVVGEQTYHLAMTHKHRGHSIYHDLQSSLRMFRDFYPANVNITAHTHSPAYMYGEYYPELRASGMPLGGAVHFITNGTFKTGHGNFEERGWGRGVLGLPTIVLWPDRHKILVLPSPEDALVFLS